MTDVLLISMPFTNLRMPSIALGLLKASLSRAGIASKVINFHLRFAELVGQEVYGAIDGQPYGEHLVGEWIFSESLFQHEKGSDLDSYVNDVLRAHRADLPDVPIYDQSFLNQLVEAISIARTKVADFLNACLEDVLAYEPRVIGFTSVFEQHLASLSLAKLIKAKRPDSCIVFGGSNCEGTMGAETLRQFKFVDAVVSGEGDNVFPEIVKSTLSFQSLPNLQGVFTRKRRHLQLSDQSPENAPIIHDLDTLPIPDYDDYFEQLADSSLKLPEPPILLFESSRGCWWGEKQHCTFCGLNGATMAYRSKSADRALNEVLQLADRYPNCNVNAVDNILEMKYFKTFISALAARKHDFGLFYEVKSNLTKEQLQLLREAGITKIQPGIESLSDNVLKIMRKGVSTLQNIQLLKWCTELDLNACDNIIFHSH